MEALNSNLYTLSKFSSKPSSEPFFSCRSLRRKSKNLRVRSLRCSDKRKCSSESGNRSFLADNEDLVTRVGRGVIGFAAAASLCCGSPSPAAAESLTVAFPVSHTREVNTVQRTLVEAWGLIRETFIDPTFKVVTTIKMEYDNGFRKGSIARSTMAKKPNETMRVLVTISVGIMCGFFIGVSFPSLPLTKLNITSALFHDFAKTGDKSPANSTQDNTNSSARSQVTTDISKIWVPSNPRGAERLPPGIVVSESDFYLRRLWGKPSEDLTTKPKYLVTFTVGYDQRKNIDAAVKKFSENFTIMLFHYDGRTSEWDEFEWSKRAIHVSAKKQTKWWYAKRFLHPDVVAAYDYIFIWDEDLGVEHFEAEEYIKLVRKYALEISQPGLEPKRGTTWQMTKRRDGQEVHKITKEKPGWCSDPHLPPCAAFVEIMAPVFSRDAWRCVWHLIQNDLVHGWGLDFALQRCVQPAHERIGVVDAQWIVHQTVPSLGNQGQADNGKAPWQGVRQRCRKEWEMFRHRMQNAEKSYYKSIGVDPSNFTAHT